MGQNDDPLQTPIGATQIRAPDGDDWRATGGRQRVEQATARGDRKMSPKERKADILSYFNDIASSSSSRSSTVPGSLWGGPESLRMAAEALQTKIFVLIETIYRDRKGYSIYKRQSKVNAGVQFLSAKKHACTGKAWEDELRQDRIKAEATNSPLSIVLKFANEHYNSLHFRTLNEPSPPANMTGTSLAKHLQGTERSKTEFKTDRSGQFDYEPVTEDPIEGSDNSSLGGSVDHMTGRSRHRRISSWNITHPQPTYLHNLESGIETNTDAQSGRWRRHDKPEQPQCPLKKTKMLSRRLAIEGDSVQKHRDLERTLQEHWEGFQEQWIQETKFPFPLLSSDHDVWTQVAPNEWERILAMLKTSSGPHHVLDHLRGPTLVDLTQVLREQVIEEGLKRLSYRTDQAETREDWSTLGKMKYGGFEVLSSDAEDPDSLYEAIEGFCVILKQTRELKAAFKNGEEHSEWSALSVIMAQVTMEVDSVEPSRC
ncbi:hypothetical protein FI667_g12726, partial [Globisporangium splendens]